MTRINPEMYHSKIIIKDPRIVLFESPEFEITSSQAFGHDVLEHCACNMYKARSALFVVVTEEACAALRAPWRAASWSFIIIMPWGFRGHKREPSIFLPCKTAGERGKIGPAAVLLFRALMVYLKRLRSHFARAVPTPQEAVTTVDFAGSILSRHSVVTPAHACTTARPPAPSPSTKVSRA